MRSDVLVYISGPMTAKNGYTIEENTAAGLRLYLELLKRGIPAFCPHLSAAFPSCFELPYETWIAYDFVIIDRCTHVLMMPRWRSSKGANLEHDYATEKNKPIAYSVAELEQMLP